VVGEETGFFGAGLIAGFAAFSSLWRALRTFVRANDDFGRYLALSVTVCVVMQALLNISVAWSSAEQSNPRPLLFGRKLSSLSTP